MSKTTNQKARPAKQGKADETKLLTITEQGADILEAIRMALVAKQQGTKVYTKEQQKTLPDALIHIDEATGFWMDDAGNIYL